MSHMSHILQYILNFTGHSKKEARENDIGQKHSGW